LKRLIIAPSAIRDLHEIHDYIANDNVDAASRWIDTLYLRFDLLCHQPGVGRGRDEVIPGYRSVAEGDYVIFYQSTRDNTLEIKRIVHGKRDLGNALTD
jgi:toxin ParE1/3/4